MINEINQYLNHMKIQAQLFSSVLSRYHTLSYRRPTDFDVNVVIYKLDQG